MTSEDIESVTEEEAKGILEEWDFDDLDEI